MKYDLYMILIAIFCIISFIVSCVFWFWFFITYWPITIALICIFIVIALLDETNLAKIFLNTLDK